MNTETPNPDTIVWFDNHFMRLAEANVSILTHSLHYGTGVFEGIRGYYEPHTKELFFMRIVEHYERWKRNCKILRIQVPATALELAEITAELCRRNRFHSHVYVQTAWPTNQRNGFRVPMDDHDSYLNRCPSYWRVSDRQERREGGRLFLAARRRYGHSRPGQDLRRLCQQRSGY